MKKPVLCLIFFLSISCSVLTNKDNIATSHMISYDIPEYFSNADKDTINVIDLTLYNRKEEKIFEWPGFIAPAILIHNNTDSCTILCTANRLKLPQDTNSELIYDRIPVFLIKLNREGYLKSSEILKNNITFFLSDTSQLIKNYEAYSRSFTNENSIEQSRKLLKLSFDLRDASLLGCITCKKKLFQIEKTFPHLASGTYAQDYFSNCAVIKEISLLLKNR